MTDRPLPDWRDGEAYAHLRGIDRTGLMWEWLRRDRGYVAWYTRASTATKGGAADPVDPILWGIHFRRVARPRRARGSDHLACRARSGHAPRHCGRRCRPRF